MVTLLLLIVLLFFFINTPFGQNWVGRQVTKRLSRDLQTKVSIKHVRFSLLNNMHLEGVLIEDRDHDTLLYAGSMTVRITDWFIFKKQAELKYVGLEDAIIKFQRSDSIWRQQFIFDYFATPKSTTAKKKAGIVFNLKKVEFKNVTFLKKDAWLGQDMSVHVKAMNMDANDISLSGNVFDVNTLNMDEPLFALHAYKGNKPADTVKVITEKGLEKADSVFFWNQGGLQIRVANLNIVNGTFKSDKQVDRQPYPYFDGQNILFTNINANLSNAGFVGDTIYSRLKLSARERSGFEVKSLSADMKFMPNGMAFQNLDLQTNRSRLRDYFSMSYDDMGDMSDFIHKVKMAAVFNDSYIDSDDIAFFAPKMNDWNRKIAIKGKLRGTVTDIVGRDLVIEAGNSTVFNGDLTLTGLPDIDQTFIDLKANDLRTTYGDAVTIIPAIRKVTMPDLRKIQYLDFKGNFTGFIHDFVTYGTVQTNLGTVKSDLNMKLPPGKQPVYSGNIETDNFQLGNFLGDKKLGMISMTGSVKGTGFSAKNRNTNFDGVIRYIDFNHYRYNNIAIKGKLDKNLFEGVASIRDDNADLDLNGVIDFNNKDPRFDLVADVAKANLKALGLTTEDYAFRGKFDLDFTSGQIDNFLGEAKISDAEITKDGHRLPFDSLVVRSVYTDSGKTLLVASNEFNAKLNGDFSLAELPAAFSVVLHRYYPAYIPLPARYPKNNQKIKFDVITYYVDEYLQLIDSSISGFNNSHIVGDLNLSDKTINLTAVVPQFRYRQYNFEDVNVLANGTGENLYIKGSAHNMTLTGNDSLSIPVANFIINAHNDSSRINLVTEANRNLDTANLNALVLTYEDGVKIEFDRSTFTLNGKTWTIDENGELAFRRKTPVTGVLQLTESDQRITVRTEPSGKGWNNLKVDLSKVNIGDLSPFILPKNRLEGLLTGHVTVEDPTNHLKITSDDIQTQYLRVDNDSLGEVRASFQYDNETGKLTAKGNTLNQENYLGFDVNVNVKDAAKSADNLIALQAKNFQLNILERFLGTLFTDIQGYLTGNVDIRGAFNNLNVTGKGRLKDAGLKVIFTQVFYDIADTDIELKSTEINLDGIVLRDTITHNPVYITGGIEHQSFKNMFYNLDIATRKPGTTDENNNRPVQLLSTSYKNNKQFYGDVKGTGSLSLLGPQDNMYMKIDAIASTQDSSYITIPPVSSRVSGGAADFLVERKYGREMTDSDFRSNSTNIIYDVDVTANPMVNVRVVLDELTGDEIKGRGEGTLNIKSGTSEPLSLRGRFDISEGNYLFTFQSFFKKPFVLRPGAENYIEWNGDPNEANIKFEAVYTAERVNFAPIQALAATSEVAAARGDVYVVANLSNKLFKPDIKFSLDFPASSPAVTDAELSLVLQQLQRNTNELNTQVTYLIVFNSFAPFELGAGNTTGAGIGINTISSILVNVISDQLNKLFGNLLRNEKYDIRINTTLYNRNLLENNKFDLGSNVKISFARSFLNNRFIISTGIGFDAPLAQSNISSQGLQFLPDVQMEWLINPTGSLRATFFYRENADYLTTTVQGSVRNARRYGASLAYRKEFDKLGDLFRRKKKAEKPAPPPPAEPVIKTTEGEEAKKGQ